MTCITEITLPFADGEYRFGFKLPQVRELESNGPVMLGLAWHLQQSIGIDDAGRAFYAGGTNAEVKGIRETIRLALIGGNLATVDGLQSEVGPQRAKELLEDYVFPARPLAEAAALAWHILAVQIYGNDHAMFAKPASSDAPAEEPGASVESRSREASTNA